MSTESGGGERVVPTTQTRSTTTGQAQEDEDYEGLDKHLDLVGWSQVNDKETEKDLS